MQDYGACIHASYKTHSHVKAFQQLCLSLLTVAFKTSHTQKEKFELPPCVSLVSAKLFIDLGVDPLRLLGLLTQAAGHHRLQRHRRSGSEKDPTLLREARRLLLAGGCLVFVCLFLAFRCSNKHDEKLC